MIVRKANAHWQGGGRDGTGSLTTDSGVLSQTPYSYRTRFQREAGTNPEELIAAAHSGCFSMSLAFQLQAAGLMPTSIDTQAAVTLETAATGFRIAKSAPTVRVTVSGIDQASFEDLARKAEQNCPVSRVLNAEITLDAKIS